MAATTGRIGSGGAPRSTAAPTQGLDLVRRRVAGGLARGGRGMIGRSRNDSSTIRATPSASGEPSSNRNFSINSPARSGDRTRAPATTDTGAEAERLDLQAVPPRHPGS